MGWLVAGGIVALVLLLVAVDRMVARGWFDRRRPHERRNGGSMAASGALGDLIDVFQPNRVHLTAEQERQKLDIMQTGDAAGRLDLDSGVVRLDPDPPRN
ncbi:hypothetical protein HP550_02695 [Cellulomonas humilata]|uniref:Uncharacterized protein n=1 Tax=Cellulomonas humilata TaxID=144055 RepID=A0A7Y6A0F2_9CELL|nr:DUF6191 domain-containing protein [Cellulomonas humilata]NUU16159.1 hypothetical protein [Cellulomonas humilata]